MTSNAEEIRTAPAAAEKANNKAPAGARRAHVAPDKGKRAKKAKKASRAPKKAHRARAGSKAATVLELLKQPGGVSLKALMKATGWQAHSVRGFLSGTLRKKLGLTVESAKADGERTYSIKS